MKLYYYEGTDSLYVDLSESPSSDSRELSDNLVADFDKHGRVVGLDIQHLPDTWT